MYAHEPAHDRRRSVAWPHLSMRGLLARLAAADARHRAQVALENLDPHLLRDIGITSSDVACEIGRLRRERL